MENRFYPNSGPSDDADRDEWLNELQRRFSVDLEQKSEVFNTNPHVEGCSSESDEEVSICRENNSSIYAPCSGLKSRDRTSVDDRIDDLYRIVKLHSQQMNLLQTQIQSLVNLVQNLSPEPKCQCNCGNQNSSKPPSFERPGNPIFTENCRLPSDVSEVLPRCNFDPTLMPGMTQNEHNFFSTVMGTLRGILSESDLEIDHQTNPEVSNSVYEGTNDDKTMLNATIEQLRRLGVSFIESRSPSPKKVTFCESSAPKSESSVEMDSLAQKYLSPGGSDDRKADKGDSNVRKIRADGADRMQQTAQDYRRAKKMNVEFNQIQNLQKKTTDLSLATLKYLKRYKLGPKGVDESAALPKRLDPPKELTPVTGKILDSIAIRSQPKLANHNQWLRK